MTLELEDRTAPVNRGKIDNLAVAILHRLSNVDEPHPSGLTLHANNIVSMTRSFRLSL